jgi:YYY domain-containing protein
MSVGKNAETPSTLHFKIAAAAILIIAALFRFYGQNWDDGHYFHPDERFIASVMDSRLSLPSITELRQLLDPANSPLNTRSDDEAGNAREFAYGSLPFLVTTVLGTIIGAATGNDVLTYSIVGVFGRALTALVDLGTIAIVILFARRAFGELAAIIAGLLTAASVVLIQLAHFFTVDTWVTFFTAASLYACLPVARTFDFRWSLAVAALGGAALATKVSVGVLGIPILVAMAIGAYAISSDWRDMSLRVGRRLLVMSVATLAVFSIFEPYAIWRPGPFFDDIRRQWEIVNGHFDIPFTRQFVGTISGVNEIENLVLWGVAPGFGLAALIATGVGIYWAVSHRDHTYILLLSWIIPYFYVIASSEARFLRYAAPLVPPLAILVGHQLALWWTRSDLSLRSRLIPAGAILLVTGTTLLWALAFMTVYAGTHPRVEASRWIYENVEPGSTLTHEIWDDRLPVRIATDSGEIYQHLGLDLYSDRSNEEAVEFVLDFLNEADYIILASQRLSHSIPRLPWRYPVQTEYYRLLDQERLGFELAFEATNFPGFGNARVNTLRADESFSVYDHPPVRIFRKVETLDREELELRFAHAAAQPWFPAREPDQPFLRLGEPVAERSGNGTGEWSRSLTDSTLLAIVVWVSSLLLFALIALPINLRVFRTLCDQGIGFSALMGWLGAGFLVWLLWSLELARLNIWLTLFAITSLGLISWFVVRPPEGWWHQLSTVSRLFTVGSFASFLIAFGIFLLMRSVNPDLWHPIFGGEKPMETAYLNAILRSGEFPPHDPWFADGAINYYYYGFFLFALLWNLTGLATDVAFQLSLATIAGLLAAGLFSLGSTLTHSILKPRNSNWSVAGGAASVVIVMFTGNLTAVGEMVASRSLNVDFWASSRAVEFAITEFPYFSLLYGDVHPHLIVAPVTVLVIALAYAWISYGADASLRSVILWVLCAGITAGSAAMINLWDGPTVAILLVTALLLPLINRVPSLRAWVFTLSAMFGVVAIGTGAFWRFYNQYSPQTDGLEITATGTPPGEWAVHFGGLMIPIALAAGVWIYNRRSVPELNVRFYVFGVGLALVASLITVVVMGSIPSNLGFSLISLVTISAASGMISRMASEQIHKNSGQWALLIVAPFIAVAGLLALSRPVGAISALIVAGFLAFYFAAESRSSGQSLLVITGASGAGLILVANLVLIADHLYGSDWQRMNTVFKLYFQSWLLLGLTAAVAVIFASHRFASTPDGFRGKQIRERFAAKPAALLMLIPAIALMFGWFAYPILASGDRLSHQMESTPSGLSLDGYAWMNEGEIQNVAGEPISFTGDYPAINWLKANAVGNPVILEASIGAYRGGGSRISSATGLPTVIGWESHQSQQRGSREVASRANDVREMYRTEDIDRKRYLLRKYAIEFVVIGDVERYTVVGGSAEDDDYEYYASESGLSAFDQMVGDELEVAFQAAGTTIYRVRPFPEVGESP